jgi:hypothetical protein
MKLPAFVKKIVAFCDYSASRYSLQGVKCETADGWSHAVGTDGRVLACVSYPDDGPDIDVVADGKSLAKLPVPGLKAGASLAPGGKVSGGVTADVPCLEGRFPEYERVLVQDGEYTCVRLDPELLAKLCDLHAAAVVSEQQRSFCLWVSRESTKPVFTSGQYGQTVIRGVLMPLAADDGSSAPPWPGRPGGAVEQPPVEVKMKPVLGTGKKRTRKAEPKPAREFVVVPPPGAAV